MTTPLRVGVIGLGLVSPPHLDAYADDDRAELAVVCDISPERAQAVGEARGVRWTADHLEVIADPEIDAVALLLPHRLHHPVGMAALEAGKHVCLEKPITATAAEADELIALAAERGLTLSVAENTQYVDAYVEAEQQVRAGRLGDIRLVRGFIPDQIIDEWADRSDPTQDWKREPYGCGAIMDCAPHMLHLLQWFFNEVESLQAFAHGWVPDVPLDNHGVITGKMVDGPLFSMEFCSLTEIPRGERLEVYGSAGTLIIEQILDPPMVFYRGDQDPHGTPVDGIAYDVEGWKPRSIAATATDFLGAVLDGREPGVTGKDSRYVISLVERAYASVAADGATQDGRRVATS